MMKVFRHFGISVGNLAQALEFYCQGLGFKAERRFERPRDYINKVTGVTSTSLKAALISRGGIVIELLEYKDRNDRPDKAFPVHYPGAAHICVEVESIEDAMNHLSTRGATFENEAVTIPPGPGEGNRVTYGRDPEGIAFELVELAREEESC